MPRQITSIRHIHDMRRFRYDYNGTTNTKTPTQIQHETQQRRIGTVEIRESIFKAIARVTRHRWQDLVVNTLGVSGVIAASDNHTDRLQWMCDFEIIRNAPHFLFNFADTLPSHPSIPNSESYKLAIPTRPFAKSCLDGKLARIVSGLSRNMLGLCTGAPRRLEKKPWEDSKTRLDLQNSEILVD